MIFIRHPHLKINTVKGDTMFNRIKTFLSDLIGRAKAEWAFAKRRKELKKKDNFIYK